MALRDGLPWQHPDPWIKMDPLEALLTSTLSGMVLSGFLVLTSRLASTHFAAARRLEDDLRPFAKALSPGEILVLAGLHALCGLGVRAIGGCLVTAHLDGIETLHLDAAQWVGRLPLPTAWDLLTLTAHKAGGLKGAGALVIRPDVTLQAQQLGGSQERGRRAGTLNPAAIASLGVVAASPPPRARRCPR